MVENIKTALKTVIQSAGFKVFEDFSTVNTLKMPSDYLAFLSVKNIVCSRRVRSCDGKKYGTEITGRAVIRLLGHKRNYDDFLTLENKALTLLEKLGTSGEILITTLDRDEISPNAILNRLENQITLTFNMLVIETVSDGEG